MEILKFIIICHFFACTIIMTVHLIYAFYKYFKNKLKKSKFKK